LNRGFDAILGNPPFLNQLEKATASTGAMAAVVHARSGGVIRGYTDLSATFLLMSARWLASGGHLVLVQPQSFLAARDAAPVRRTILVQCALRSLWVSNEHVFEDAAVYVCAPTLWRDGPRRGELARSVTARFEALPSREINQDELAVGETWSHLAAAAGGIPELSLDDHSELATIAEATADFRDQYYGLAGFLVEDSDVPAERRCAAECPAIITTGLVDLAECLWGRTSTRILKRKWQAPRVDRVRMRRDGSLGAWLDQRLVKKVMLATQTRILEVFVDELGEFVPSIPLLTVTPKVPDDLWRVASVLASPVSAAVAMCKYAGTALSADAIKLSAAQVARLPLPRSEVIWQAGCEQLRIAHQSHESGRRTEALRVFGQTMSRAYGLEPDVSEQVYRWWVGRLVGKDHFEEDQYAEV
jgi:hypothetical protein